MWFKKHVLTIILSALILILLITIAFLTVQLHASATAMNYAIGSAFESTVLIRESEVTMKAEQDTYDKGTKKLNFIITDPANLGFGYSDGFYIEKKVFGSWLILPFKDWHHSLSLEYNENLPEENRGYTERTLTVDLSELLYPVSSGEYRICKVFDIKCFSDNAEQVYKTLLTAEFKIR
jgi:hypothetical protein